jgi:hypothetical protein
VGLPVTFPFDYQRIDSILVTANDFVRRHCGRRVRLALGQQYQVEIHRFLRSRVLLALTLVLGLACSNMPSPSDFRVGTTREEVLESFGTPSREQSFFKTGESIWGPIEDFWSQVPLNSTVEVWAYRVQGGTVELYFVDDSERVQGIGFVPEGAVFEADH